MESDTLNNRWILFRMNYSWSQSETDFMAGEHYVDCRPHLDATTKRQRATLNTNGTQKTFNGSFAGHIELNQGGRIIIKI